MRKYPFFKGLMKNLRASWVNLACVLMIPLITSACAGGYSKQTLSNANETRQVSANGESQNGETNDDQKIECRWERVTGSILRRKVCATKELWAKIEEKFKRDAEEMMDDFRDQYCPPDGDCSGTSTEPANP